MCKGKYDVEADMVAAEAVVAVDECGGGSQAKAGSADDAAEATRGNEPPRCAVRAHSSSDSAGEGTDEEELEDDDDDDDAANVLDAVPAPVAVAEALVLRFLIDTEAAVGCALGGCSYSHVALS